MLAVDFARGILKTYTQVPPRSYHIIIEQALRIIEQTIRIIELTIQIIEQLYVSLKQVYELNTLLTQEIIRSAVGCDSDICLQKYLCLETSILENSAYSAPNNL
jgi:hypothetical protein